MCDGTAGPPRRGSAAGHAAAGALDEIRQPFGHARYGDQEDEEDHGNGQEPQQGDEDVAQRDGVPEVDGLVLDDAVDDVGDDADRRGDHAELTEEDDEDAEPEWADAHGLERRQQDRDGQQHHRHGVEEHAHDDVEDDEHEQEAHPREPEVGDESGEDGGQPRDREQAGEHRRTDHDEEDRRGGRHRGHGRVRDLSPGMVAPLFPQAQQNGAKCGRGSRLGGGEDAGEHAAEEDDEDHEEAPDSAE